METEIIQISNASKLLRFYDLNVLQFYLNVCNCK